MKPPEAEPDPTQPRRATDGRLLRVSFLLILAAVLGLSSALTPLQPVGAGPTLGSQTTNVSRSALFRTVQASELSSGEEFIELLPGRLILDTSEPLGHDAETEALAFVSSRLYEQAGDRGPSAQHRSTESNNDEYLDVLLDPPRDQNTADPQLDAGPTAPAPTVTGPDESSSGTNDIPSDNSPSDEADGSDSPEDGSPDDDTSAQSPEAQDPDADAEPEPEPIGLIAPTASGSIRLCFDGSVPPIVRQEALAAANRWDEVLEITGPVVEIDFYWLNFSNPRILGAAGPTRFVVDPSFPEPTARYPIALANELTGIDHAVRGVCDQSGQGEIVMVLNANAGNDAGGWAAGDVSIGHAPEPDDATDLQTTMLHELGHGFGFIGSAEINLEGDLAWPNDAESPLVFDLLTKECVRELPTGCHPLDAKPVEVGDLAAVTGEHLWIETGLGPLLELEAPVRWDSGSSFSHLDELRYTTDTDYSLMTPYIDAAQRLRTVDSATLAVLQRIGWVLRTPAAPLVSGTVTPGPNQFRLTIDPTDLRDGPPPSSYEVLIRRVQADASGELELQLAYAPVVRMQPSTTVNGIANNVVYRLDLRGINGRGAGDSVRTGPVLPQPQHPVLASPTQILRSLTGDEPIDSELDSFSSAAAERGLNNALSEVFAARSAGDVALIRLYLGYLDREPDFVGLTYWLERLDNGNTLGNVVDEFVRSSALESDVGLSNGHFVRSLYTRILGRDAENAGLAFWTSQLDDGRSRGEVLLAISESSEHQAATPVLPGLILAYVRFESRMPSLDETELWYQNIRDRGFGDLLSALTIDAIALVEFHDNGTESPVPTSSPGPTVPNAVAPPTSLRPSRYFDPNLRTDQTVDLLGPGSTASSSAMTMFDS